MYKEHSEESHKYEIFVAEMRALYPEWETRDLVYITHNITIQTTMRSDADKYFKAFRAYIEKTSEYFLWLREMFYPITVKDKQNVTLDQRAKAAFKYANSFAAVPAN